jgi:hypothetical protein
VFLEGVKSEILNLTPLMSASILVTVTTLNDAGESQPSEPASGIVP